MTVPTLEKSPFDHISLGVADLERAVTFWDAALAPLGWELMWRNQRSAGFGPAGFRGEAPLAVIDHGESARSPGPGFHLALIAPDRHAVTAFHAAAIAAGGTDDGGPGVRENYDPGYFAAFVTDPDGHRVEAVVHEVVHVENDADEDLSPKLREAIARAEAASEDVALQIEAAYECDRSGLEARAAEFYDAAWKLGVPDEARAEFMICYGSTLRNVGRTREAREILERHLADHPQDQAARCFYALALLSDEDSRSSVAELLDVILEAQGDGADSGLWPAIASYRDELRD